ncbi:hypothetical protein PANT111_460067 [Pantoea brenneri]|uniref:Transposase n=1 Tax=Pantoea brenneri TaxID=472694 RepID=A0AAX3JB55_9GAMM|nr:hypothetical protein PANT111_460067 [Pantoea brenneri]
MTLSDVIGICPQDYLSQRPLYSAIHRHGRYPGPVRPEKLTPAFTRV